MGSNERPAKPGKRGASRRSRESRDLRVWWSVERKTPRGWRRFPVDNQHGHGYRTENQAWRASNLQWSVDGKTRRVVRSTTSSESSARPRASRRDGSREILTNERGVPFEQPRRVDFDSDIAFLRAFNAYKDRVANAANASFSDAFRRSMRRDDDDLPPQSERFVFETPRGAEAFEHRMRVRGFRPTRERGQLVRVRAPGRETKRALDWVRTYGRDAASAMDRLSRAAKDFVRELSAGATRATLDRIWETLSERQRATVREFLRTSDRTPSRREMR